ncbi:aminotransferase class IV [Flavisolibacter sp. BT320]|nr:aminotransferase class IV [Flavisolibacter longurius]
MQVCFNGEFFPANAPLLTIQNRSFKWGDGVFETAKVFRGRLLLESLHFERLWASLRLLGTEVGKGFTQDSLVAQVLELCQRNDCLELARIRLAVYRQEDNTVGYSIEAVPLEDQINRWQDEGLEIVLYPFARKSMDALANLKSANFLPYVLAQRYALERGVDDAIVLNAQNFLCDSSKANLFLLRGNNLYTPALHQGCVNGVMRRVVLEECKRLGYRTFQDEVEESHLLSADEVFLTNAIQIIRWVRKYKTASYSCTQTQKIFEATTATIFRGHC